MEYAIFNNSGILWDELRINTDTSLFSHAFPRRGTSRNILEKSRLLHLMKNDL